MTAIESGELLELAAPRITYSTVVVSSETAKRWLARNAKNRPINRNAVARYAADMAAGRWAFAGDPIRFDHDGNLIDGQHRLSALAETHGLSLPFLVLRGLPTETQSVMDQGSKRTPGDQLSLIGVKNYNNIASGVKLYIQWADGLLFRDNKIAARTITAPHIEEFVRNNRALIDGVNEYMNSIRSNDAAPTVSVAAALVFHRIDPDASREFFELLHKGGTPFGHPINTLDKRLQRVRREGLKLSQRDSLAFFVLAWNAWRDGREMHKFQRPRGGRWSESTFPEPR